MLAQKDYEIYYRTTKSRWARLYSYCTKTELIQFFSRVNKKELGRDWNECKFFARIKRGVK